MPHVVERTPICDCVGNPLIHYVKRRIAHTDKSRKTSTFVPTSGPITMKTCQHRWTPTEGWVQFGGQAAPGAQLVLVFGARDQLKAPERLAELGAIYPRSQ